MSPQDGCKCCQKSLCLLAVDFHNSRALLACNLLPRNHCSGESSVTTNVIVKSADHLPPTLVDVPPNSSSATGATASKFCLLGLAQSRRPTASYCRRPGWNLLWSRWLVLLGRTMFVVGCSWWCCGYILQTVNIIYQSQKTLIARNFNCTWQQNYLQKRWRISDDRE